MKYKVTFYKKKCALNRICDAVCPKFWVYDAAKDEITLKGSKKVKDGVFEVEIDEKDLECNKNAERGCPLKAIKVEKIKK